MKKFEISADSTCDFYCDEIKSSGIFVTPLDFVVTKNNEIVERTDNFASQEEYEKYYEMLKNGYNAKTSILNVQKHIDLFYGMAKKGVKKALHISLGYGLSHTLDNATRAIEEVKKDFPTIHYEAIESNSATIGEGFLVKAAIKMRDEGKTLEEAVKKLEEIKHFTQHFILANDLKFLARGGRISQLSANVGSLLQIKPIIEFDKGGKLQVVRKEIGLKKAMNSILNDFSKFSLNKEFPYIAIVHTGAEALAKEFQDMFKNKYGIEPEVRIMGPIIGAHVGPSAIAYAFVSNEERPY